MKTIISFYTKGRALDLAGRLLRRRLRQVPSRSPARAWGGAGRAPLWCRS